MRSKLLNQVLSYLSKGGRIRRAIAGNQRVIDSLPSNISERISHIMERRRGSAEIVRAFKPLLRDTKTVYAVTPSTIDAPTAQRFNQQLQSALDTVERVTGKRVHDVYRTHKFAPGDFSHADFMIPRTSSGLYRGGGAYHNPEARGIPPLSRHYDDRTELRSLRDMLGRTETAQTRITKLRSQLRRYYLTNAAVSGGFGISAAGGGTYAYFLRKQKGDTARVTPSDRRREESKHEHA